MNSAQLLQAGLLGMGLCWLALVCWSLAGRRRHDRLARRLAACRAARPAPDAGAAAQAAWRAAAFALLRALPRRRLDALARDGAQADWLQDLLATHLLARYGARRLLDEAAGRRRRGGSWRRIAALCVLCRAGARDLPALLHRAVAGADADVAGAAVVLLGRQHTRAAGATLVCALRHGWYAPSCIALQLERFPPLIGELLAPLLDDPQASVRAWAIALLARQRGLDWLDARLARHAHDPDAGVRKAVVQALGELGGPRAVAVASALVGDEAGFVRVHAVRALGRLCPGGDGSFGPLVAPLLADRDWWVRLAAREALAAMGMAVWRDVEAQTRSDDGFARDGAREVLRQIGMAQRAAGGRAAAAAPSAALVREAR